MNDDGTLDDFTQTKTHNNKQGVQMKNSIKVMLMVLMAVVMTMAGPVDELTPEGNSGDLRYVDGTMRAELFRLGSGGLWALGYTGNQVKLGSTVSGASIMFGSGSIDNAMYINSNGDVGINTITQDYALDVNGQIQCDRVRVGDALSALYTSDDLRLQVGSTSGGSSVVIHSGTVNEAVIIHADGDVQIGTVTAKVGYKLSVDGKVVAEEILVEDSGDWPDYVFKADYKLKSLSEVENYINTNGHLEGIPSAKEVAENGILLGKTNAMLLEKIEELTLHMIALEKKLKK
jgi:hypothetical protein